MIKNFLISLLTILAFAMPSYAAAPSVKKQAKDGDSSVDFGMMTVDFVTSNTAGVYSLGFSYPLFSLDWSNGAGGFAAELHVCDTPNGGGGGDLSASGECTLVKALATTDLTVDSFKSKKRYIVVEIQTAGTGKLTIKGSWDQISSGGAADLIDSNADGLYEYVKFPQDFDGDGTTWKTCDCGGTDGMSPGYNAGYICGWFRTSDYVLTQVDYSGASGPYSADAASNPVECRFHGQRVWDDATDDINALYGQSESGIRIDVEPGTYALKGMDVPTTDDADSVPHVSTTCWDSSTSAYGDSCPTTPDGRVLGVSTEIPKDFTKFIGAGADSNGDIDLKYEGSMFVTNNGPRPYWDSNTVSNGAFNIGQKNITGASASITEATTTNALGTYNSGEVCVNNTSGFVDDLEVGNLVMLTISYGSGYIKRQFVRVTNLPDTACTSGKNVILGGADIVAATVSDGTIYQNWVGADIDPALTTSLALVLENKLSTGIELAGVWFTHLDHIGVGNCQFTDTEVAPCDTGVLLRSEGSLNAWIHDIGLIQSSASFGSGQAINTYAGAIGLVLERSVLRYNQGGLMDIPQYGVFRNNIVSDNSVIRDISYTGTGTQLVSLLRNQADNVTIEQNYFERNTAPTHGNYITKRKHYSVIDMNGYYHNIRRNFFQNNQMTCLIFKDGARNGTVEQNTFDCGADNDYSPNGTWVNDSSDRAFDVVIQSKGNEFPFDTTGDLVFRGNKFIGYGGYYLNEVVLGQNLTENFYGRPRAHILITGSDFNCNGTNASGGACDTTATGVEDEDNDLFGLIRFEDNYFFAADDLWSHAVLMRVAHGNSNGDPDAERLIFDRNHLNQGNLFGHVWETLGADANNGNTSGAFISGGNQADMDPDHDGDFAGLPRCGVNFDGETPVLVWENNQIDGEHNTTPISGLNISNGTAIQFNDQCDSYLD